MVITEFSTNRQHIIKLAYFKRLSTEENRLLTKFMLARIIIIIINYIIFKVLAFVKNQN